MKKETFIKMMQATEAYNKVLWKLEKALGIAQYGNALEEYVDSIVEAISIEMESHIDDDIGPMIYHYMYAMEYGNKPKTFIIGDKEYDVYDYSSLYDYLVARNEVIKV